MPTGYGQQAGIFGPRIAALGHDLAFACWAGHYGGDTEWQGFKVFPHTAMSKFAEDVIDGHYRRFNADLCIRLNCVWPLKYAAWFKMRVASWTPIDTAPVDERTQWNLRQDGSRVIAMSEFGRRQLGEAHFECAYVPHGIDTSVFQPGDRAAARKMMGIPDGMFVVGINAGNADRVHDRKAWHENLSAFAAFHAKHPDSVLYMHTMALSPEGINLPKICDLLGITAHVQFSDPYQYACGGFTPESLAAWYSACDVVLCTSKAEGFGITAVEAQACGTPVIVSDGHTGPQLQGPGWRVKCEPYLQWDHGAYWERPLPREIARALERAYRFAADRRADARAFALAYDADRVTEQYWKPVLDEFA